MAIAQFQFRFDSRSGFRLALAAALAALLTMGMPVLRGQNGGSAAAGAPDPAAPEPAPEAQPEANVEAAGAPAAAEAQRTRLNLLGEVDTKSGEGRRNENVRLILIDNNVLKELQTRMGTTATIFDEFSPERKYFGREFGGSPSQPLHLAPLPRDRFHGELFWSHNNSIFSARSFFQVGEVQPARANDYGFNFTTPLGGKTELTMDASQGKLRGQVNGNVLAPAITERTPTAADPATRAVVQAVLNAYGPVLPNSTNPRLLNTNAPQNIDNDRVSLTLDRTLSERDHLTLRHSLTLQNVEAFQLVGGQNPDTATKHNDSKITWSRAWDPSTVTDFSAGFERVASLLVPEETSLGPVYLFSNAFETIGPDGNTPVFRAQNIFRYAGRLRRVQGNHSWTAGFDVARRQINGFESLDHRGFYSFRNDFGQDVSDNLLAGRASMFRIALGSSHRGFRNWMTSFFVGDDWRAAPKLSLNFGLRFEPSPQPNEVNDLTAIPYDCDCNNFAPTFGFAYNASERWGVFRGAYGIHYGEIFPVSYMQARFNAPGVRIVSINAPDLLNPLQGQPEGDERSTLHRLDPELSWPYSHQYNFTWELRPVGDWVIDLGYLGSRSIKLLQAWYENRAQRVEGIPFETSTINQRRPDQRYYDILHVLNSSRGYYDAAKVTLRVPDWGGLNLEASYWFSKAIDLGSGYTNTAFDNDGRNGRSPYEFDVHGLMKGPSEFDQSHAGLWTVNYSGPALHAAPKWIRGVFGNWQLSSVILWKTGTPFDVRTSDGPDTGNADGAGSDRPMLLDVSALGNVVDDPDTATQMLPSAAFGPLPPGAVTGNLGNSTFRKDGIFNLNSGLSRRFVLGGERSLLFRVESLNLFNHAQFAEPDKDHSSKNFGTITNTLNDGRAFRFTLRFGF